MKQLHVHQSKFLKMLLNLAWEFYTATLHKISRYSAIYDGIEHLNLKFYTSLPRVAPIDQGFIW